MRQILLLLRGRRTASSVGRWGGSDSTPIILTLGIWICTLPFVFLLVTPRFGTRAAIITALVLLAGLTVVCFALCIFGRAGSPVRERGNGEQPDVGNPVGGSPED